jgi:hypothetical protein
VSIKDFLADQGPVVADPRSSHDNTALIDEGSPCSTAVSGLDGGLGRRASAGWDGAA